MILDTFEQDLTEQMNQECSLEYELDPDDKIIRMKISLEGLRNAVQLEYYSTNGSIRVIEPQFD